MIGTSNLRTSRLGYGCMRVAGTWNPASLTENQRENAHKCIVAAYEAGYTLFDHADIYARGLCEQLHGEVLKKVSEMRDNIIIATKCGVRFAGDPEGSVGKYDFSFDHIVNSCDKSLQRLGIETIDIYQLHRPDILMNPEEVARAFEHLYAAGKVRYFGVSNFTASYVSLLQQFLSFKLQVNQVEISLTHRNSFFDGTLDQCMMENLTPLAWSPVGGGALGKEDSGDLHQELTTMAAKYATGPAEIAVAWLLQHPSAIVPIIGTAKPERVRSMIKADEIKLTREDWYALLVAAQGHPMA